MTRAQESCTIWVCVDCRDIEANGGTRGMDPDRTFDREPWGLIDSDESVESITPGLIADEHDSDCPNLGFLPCPAACDDGDADPDGLAWVECSTCGGTGHGPRMDYDGSHDEPCEDQEFSWQRCEGCGSTLGGSRHAYSIWLKEEQP